MKRLNWLFISVNILFIVMPGGCNRIPTLPDNCTCDTGHGIYSLFPLRSTHGPKFSESGFLPHPGYTYDYNPCVPFTKTSPEGKCINVALCKYNKGDQPVYSDIGEQRKVQCEISDGKISLIYPVHNNNISTHESKVILKCSNNSLADSQFTLTDEDSMTFTLSSICGCPNQCLPVTTKGGPLSTKPNTTPSSGPEDKGLHLNWKLVILLPSLAGFLVLVIFFVCLWRRLPVIQEALLCRCCHCCEYRDIRDPVREEGIVSATETSSLINNQMNSRAVEHEDSVAKDKVKEPVQVEDGDVEEDCKFAGKGDRTVVV